MNKFRVTEEFGCERNQKFLINDKEMKTEYFGEIVEYGETPSYGCPAFYFKPIQICSENATVIEKALRELGMTIETYSDAQDYLARHYRGCACGLCE